MKRIIALAIMLPTSAMATQTSMLCKATDGTYVDIVSAGRDPSSALVQIDGGHFFEGHIAFTDPQIVVTVPFDKGLFLLSWDIRQRQGSAMLMVGDKRTVSNVECRFRQ